MNQFSIHCPRHGIIVSEFLKVNKSMTQILILLYCCYTLFKSVIVSDYDALAGVVSVVCR